MGVGTSESEETRPELPARVHREPRATPRRGHQTSRHERSAIIVLAVGAAVVGGLSVSSSLLNTHALWRAVFAGLVTLAASRARRWSWLVLAGMAAVASPQNWWLAVCGVAVAGAFVATLVPRRRIYGALVGAASVQGLLRTDDVGFSRSSALLVVIAVAPVLASAYAVSPRRVRRRIHRIGLVAAGLATIGVVAFGVAAALSYSSLQAAQRQAVAGLEAAGDGKGPQAAGELREAAASFARANRHLGSWWAAPVRLVPFAGQQAEAIIVSSREGETVTLAAARSVDQADIQQFRYEDGGLDVARLRGLERPLDDAAEVVDQAVREIQAARSPWLIGPVADRVDELDRRLSATLPQLRLGAAAARTAPGLLGADGPRRYLVLFTQPSEARALGGFVGNWVELTASAGRVEVTRSGRAVDINELGDREARALTSPPVPRDYLARYGRFRPATYFQDVTVSPDMPSVAAAAAQVFQQTVGDQIDGVLVVDPYAVASLLTFTGPISIEGAPRLTAENAADILVRRQYTEFGSEDTREDFLDEASRVVFEQLVTGSLPGPRQLGDVLSPMVDQGRLLFHVFDPQAHDLIDRLGVDGSFAPPERSDYFQVVTQNNANNKIDLYLHREIDYDVHYDPTTGQAQAKLKLTLRNDAPDQGLPSSVIGSNDQGLPPGTNRSFVSIYSPLGLRGAQIGADQVPMEYQRELGAAVYSRYITIPAGGSVTLELDLFGRLDVGTDYRLRVGAQPLVNPDDVTLHVRAPSEWEIGAVERLGVDLKGQTAVAVAEPNQPFEVRAQMVRP